MPSYSRLTESQRYTIETLHRKGTLQSKIAEILNVHPSTISRELRRLGPGRSYSHRQAHRDHQELKKREQTSDPRLLSLAAQKLREEQWSPAQISGWLTREGEGSLSHETIYAMVYRDQKSGGDLHHFLRHPAKSYRKRSAEKERRGRIKNQIMIDQRPPIVEERTRIGDWEMDTVIGRPGGPVLVTMVERRSRFSLIRLVSSKEAVVVTAAILEATKPYRDKVLSHTYDNGKEFAMHELLTEVMEAQAYFAHPYHSWERGLNENTNGLIRQYFPKKSDFSTLTQKDVKEVQDKLNRRPRKCLDFKTPNDIFFASDPIALAA
jgi:IS30 family transposase